MLLPMRKRWIQDTDGKLVPEEEFYEQMPEVHYVMGDINEYRSMATGEIIGGRRQHREHLRQHGLIEIGNEVRAAMTKQPMRMPDREKRKRLIGEVMAGKGY
jgi:hypothetical protein